MYDVILTCIWHDICLQREKDVDILLEMPHPLLQLDWVFMAAARVPTTGFTLPKAR